MTSLMPSGMVRGSSSLGGGLFSLGIALALPLALAEAVGGGPITSVPLAVTPGMNSPLAAPEAEPAGATEAEPATEPIGALALADTEPDMPYAPLKSSPCGAASPTREKSGNAAPASAARSGR